MKNDNLNTLDFIQVMTVEKIKEKLNALKLTYNISVGVSCTKHQFNLVMIQESNFVEMCELYNRGKVHKIAFNWPNGTSISIERLTALKKHFNAPEDAQIYLEFTRNYETDGTDDIVEFRWNRSYKDFNEFYTDCNSTVERLVRFAQNEHQTAAKFQAKLDKFK